jgi:hypothetical protein
VLFVSGRCCLSCTRFKHANPRAIKTPLLLKTHNKQKKTSVEIDSKNFAKLSRDCRLLCRALTPTDVDLIFTAKKPKGGRKIGYEAFLSALDAIASKKGCSFDEVARAVVGAGGPVDNGTKAEAVRLHDDKVCFAFFCFCFFLGGGGRGEVLC